MVGQVRRAARADVETLVILNRDVQRLHAQLYVSDFKAQTDDAAVANFFSNILAADGQVVAVHENKIGACGYIWFEVQDRPETPFTPAARRLFIRHISVREQARRKGIASDLLAWAESFARSAGIEEMLVDHWTNNVAARAFFSRSGFASLREVRRKRLAGL